MYQRSYPDHMQFLKWEDAIPTLIWQIINLEA